jgi:acyl-CoA synthetase (AMP-forming)/AMP-acid ligase II
MHTPYGATECLPISSIEAAEILGETSVRTDQGAGICVGRKFDSIDWRVIRITEDPIATIDDVEELPMAEVGELIVRGPQISTKYVTCVEANAQTKIADQDEVWHRTGDVGHLDKLGRFWYCGRKSQRVDTVDGPFFTECVEAVFNTHADVARTALVGLGPRGNQRPVVFFELIAGTVRAEIEMAKELHRIGQRFIHTRSIRLFAEFDRLPIDVRHNSKILRDELVECAKELELQCIDNPTPSE